MEVARQLAQTLAHGDVLAFRGGMGVGKTAFTRGLVEGLGATDAVSSPTFAIVSVYRGGRLMLAHFDMYRIHTAGALEDTGYYDFLRMYQQPGIVYAVEWSENIAEALPDDAIVIAIERTGDQARKILIEGGRT